jgi:hypothetical protein
VLLKNGTSNLTVIFGQPRELQQAWEQLSYTLFSYIRFTVITQQSPKLGACAVDLSTGQNKKKRLPEGE